MQPIILAAMYEYVQDDGGLPTLRRLFRQVDYRDLPITLSFFVVWSFELEPQELGRELQFVIRIVTPGGTAHDSKPRLMRLPSAGAGASTAWTVIEPYVVTFRKPGVHEFRLVAEGHPDAVIRIELARKPEGWIPLSE